MKNTFSVAALCAVLTSPGLAFAQEGAEGEVIVTATRREQALQDVPVTVSAITSATLDRAGIVETSDLAAQVPNLIIASPYGRTQPNFILRGISVGNEFNSNNASPIGFYVDENYISARFAQGMQLFDLERVEVVKGPQGTLYGRNTTGGAI
jgi:iron complex outermembrane receptor protein